ncbi:bactofilin family protein [Parahaliea aestuarii]|uniref:Polymer-forming cytoskeletal protein n=1 Tax=Parahaliea aestuarii TaxID=1852021 RepID=A0A5C8ZPJ2_9GAMM|nr:polymer-forming cytoskeletal protein [Parahaliea aestuarii]TXS89467.1 polymer-forming cytoskeletal protein [Parahaliea aestuarii]
MWRSRKSAATTLVSRDTLITGDIHFSGMLDIEGTVHGNIIARPDSDALVRVIDGGCVEGEIRSPVVIVNGEVRGNVHASLHIELAPRARVSGDVYYALIEMAAGCAVNGQLVHTAALADARGEAESSNELTSGFTAATLAKVD